MEAASTEVFATTIVNVEEQLRGWLARVHGLRDAHKQVEPYEQLARLFDFFHRWKLIPFDAHAADEFKRLQKQRIRIGTQDLKIASIALVQDAVLLSVNLRDFHRVPGLRVESWLA
jgi:tRNA(fMet)-specific endonuclease VapC